MVRCERHDDRCRVCIEGEMTIYNAAAIREQLVAVADEPCVLEIDLAGVTEIDTAGIQLLIASKKQRVRENRPLALLSHSAPVVDAFELMGLIEYFRDPVVLARKQGGRHES